MTDSFADLLGWIPKSQNLRESLSRAFLYAEEQSHRYVTIEHLLLALTEDPDSITVLVASQVDLDKLRDEIAGFVSRIPDRLPVDIEAPPIASDELGQIFDYASAAAEQSMRQRIDGAIVLAALVGEGKSPAAELLRQHGVTFEGAIRTLQTRKAPPVDSFGDSVGRAGAVQASPRSASSQPAGRHPGDGEQGSRAPDPRKPDPRPLERRPAEPRPSEPRPPEPRPSEPGGFQPRPTETVSRAGLESRETDAFSREPGRAEQRPLSAEGRPAMRPVGREDGQTAAGPGPRPRPQPAPAVPPHPNAPARLPASGRDDAAAERAAHPEPNRGPRTGEPGEPGGPMRSPAHAPANRPVNAASPRPAPRPGVNPTFDPAGGPGHPGAVPPGRPNSHPVPHPGRPAGAQPGGRPTGGLAQGGQAGPRPMPPHPSERPGERSGERLAERANERPGQPPMRGPQPPRPHPGAHAAPHPNRPGGPMPPVQPRRGPPPGAGAPGPMPSQASAPGQAPASAATPASSAKSDEPRGRAFVESGVLVENIPRRMRVGVSEQAEVRIARREVAAMIEGMTRGMTGRGSVESHDVLVTQAMSVRLRSPDSSFWIEAGAQETQWVENQFGFEQDDFARWRFTITPKRKGTGVLQVLVAARTTGADGISADAPLPDQVIEVRVRTNYGALSRRVAIWGTAALLGGVLGRYGERAVDLLGWAF